MRDGCTHTQLLFLGDDVVGKWVVCEECQPVRVWRLYEIARRGSGVPA